MINRVMVAVVMVMVLAVPGVWAQTPAQITVYGTAEIEVTPDEMVWFLKVENRGKEIKPVAKQHSVIVSDVLSFLSGNKIAGKDVQTSMMQFGESWEYQNGRRIPAGYYAASNIRFTLSDFSKYQVLWEGLAEKPGAGVMNISYGFAGRAQVQAKARHQALRAARDKASAMAKSLDTGIGSPLAIEEIVTPETLSRANLAMAEGNFKSGAGDSGGFALGRLEITSRVKVSFSLKE